MTGGDVTRLLSSTSEKIFRRHRERLAVVYIRQSTVQQVERHQELTRLQYALVDRAFHLGWARESIVVVDDDLGRSGATIEGRLGFQRLVAEVGLGNVGLVLGIEMSRLARSCRDWHQLLEICSLFDTLIADTDGIIRSVMLMPLFCWPWVDNEVIKRARPQFLQSGDAIGRVWE